MRSRLSQFLAVFAAAVSLTGAASAAGSLFVVRGVQVEATGESGVKACEQAYSQGHAAAWPKLIERIVPQADWSKAPTPSAEDLAAFVSGYEVSGEKRSTSKCIANMTYLFKGDLVKKHLRDRGVAYADRRGPATLALPLYDKPDGTRLWGDDNLWLNAFRDVKLENELIPVEAPFGDDGDKAAVPPGTELGTDWLTYKTIASKYGMKAVLVARATYANGQTTVNATLVSENGSENFTATGTADDERGSLRDAVRKLGFEMNESWKEKAAIDNSVSAYLSVWAPYSSLSERNSIEQRLRKVQNVLELSVTRITVTGMSLGMRYRGRKDQFAEALKQAGFGIYRRSGQGGLVLTGYQSGEAMDFGGPSSVAGNSEVETSGPAPEPEIEDPQIIRPQ
jgi:hypothetical protein